ncbi:MAG: CAP domain-containing protein [Rhizobiaceae bacterium]
MNRRLFLHATALLAVLPLAACQGVLSPHDARTKGESVSGAAYLSRIRSEHGLPALAADSGLETAAAQQAGYMAGAGRMSHTTGWRRDFATRMDRNRIAGPAAENVAHGRMDLDRLFDMWMNSAGHRRNMLDPRFGKFGLASATAADGDRYWALVLAK